MVRAAAFKVGSLQPQKAGDFFDNNTILALGKILKIEVAKNLSFQDQLQLFKSKQFICHTKTLFT